MTLTSEFLLLQQEGYLFRSCLTNGLTELRAAHVHNKGAFYSASFNLSIGLERLLKSIIIIEHMLKNDLKAPTIRELREYGHSIEELYVKASEIGELNGCVILAAENFDPPNQKLLKLLTDFSIRSRYHNLDSIADKSLKRIDPLELWDELLLEILASDAKRQKVNSILSCSAALGKEMEEFCTPIMQSLTKDNLSMAGVLALPALHELAVRYIVFRIIRILSPLRHLIGHLSHQSYTLGTSSPAFPQMQEFLEWVWDDRAFCMRKKKWP